MQTTLRSSQEIPRQSINRVSNTRSLNGNRSQVFLDFFNRGLYELQGQDNNIQFGLVDVYHMNQREFERQQAAISDQKNNISRMSTTQSSGQYVRNCTNNPPHRLYDQEVRNQNGQVALHQHLYLGPYQLEGDLPKWLPFRIGKKVIQNPSQQLIDKVRLFVDVHAQERLNKSPEFSRIYAYEILNNGQQIVMYYEYLNILSDEIDERRDSKMPFSEELLWALLFSLTSASANANPQFSLTDVRPSKVFYENFKGQVLPYELTEGRQIPLTSKLNSNESIFVSPEFQADLRSSRFDSKNSTTFNKNFNNESYQIGLTVLASGLLLQENELANINQQALTSLLNDFGQIYGRSDRLLQYVLQELFIFRNRLSPAQILRYLNPQQGYIIFLDLQFKNTLRQQLVQDPTIQNSLFNFEQSHPTITNPRNLQRNFLDRYEPVFFYTLYGNNAQRPTINTTSTIINKQSTGLRSSETGNIPLTIRQSSNQEGHVNSVYRTTAQPQNINNFVGSQTINNLTGQSQRGLQQSINRQ